MAAEKTCGLRGCGGASGARMDMATDIIGPAGRREQACRLPFAELPRAAAERLVGAIGWIERGVEARAGVDIALCRCPGRGRIPGAGRCRRGPRHRCPL